MFRLANYGRPGEGVLWINGLLAMIAAITLAGWLGGSGWSAGGIGALAGVVYGLVGRTTLALSYGETILDGLALIPAVLDLFRVSTLDAVAEIEQLIFVAILVVVYLLTMLLSLLMHLCRLPPPGAMVFGFSVPWNA